MQCIYDRLTKQDLLDFKEDDILVASVPKHTPVVQEGSGLLEQPSKSLS